MKLKKCSCGTEVTTKTAKKLGRDEMALWFNCKCGSTLIMKAKKIRLKTWYWGKYVYNKELGLKLGQPDVEEYKEELHGWHHSEEFKTEQAQKKREA